MPFTLAHPAAILPLARTPLVPSALVAGALAPDLPYYLSLRWLGGDYNLTLTHTASSLLWLDPLIALALLVGFHLLLKQPLLALLPERAAARAWPAAQGFAWRSAPAAVWIALSVIVGASTHLAWDALGEAAGSAVSQRVDLAGTAVGSLALLGWFLQWWRTTPPRPLPPGTVLPRQRRHVVLLVLVTATVLAGALGALRELPEVQQALRDQGLWNAAEGLRYGSRIFVEHAGTAAGAALTIYAVGRQVTRRARAPRRRWPRPARSPR